MKACLRKQGSAAASLAGFLRLPAHRPLRLPRRPTPWPRARTAAAQVPKNSWKSAAVFAAENMPQIMAKELGRGKGAEEAVRHAYLRTDEEFCSASDDAENSGGGGVCAVTTPLREVEGSGRRRRRLAVSGVVLSRGGKAEALTDDHRASRRHECNRIDAQRGGRWCSTVASCGACRGRLR